MAASARSVCRIGIVTEGDTWEELRDHVKEVVRAFYFDQPEKLPATIRIHLVRDEVLALA